MCRKHIKTIEVNEDKFYINSTSHFLQKINERDINIDLVIKTILDIGKDKLVDLEKRNIEVMVINPEQELSVIVGLSGNDITIITAINKSQIIVKEDTLVVVV